MRNPRKVGKRLRLRVACAAGAFTLGLVHAGLAAPFPAETRLGCDAGTNANAGVHALPVSAAGRREVLVDFARDRGFPLYSAQFKDPQNKPHQKVQGADGLTIAFDGAREAKPAAWCVVGVPRAVGRRLDWFGRTVELVLGGVPQGRVSQRMTLTLTDAEDEHFQFRSVSKSVDADGRLRLRFVLDEAHLPKHTSWGKKVNRRVDGGLSLSSVDMDFKEKTGTGSVRLVRIEDVAAGEAPRAVTSVEPISVDTSYPGAAPFPGAESLRFRLTPAFSGPLTLMLSTESQGEVWKGRKLGFPGVATNGVVTFRTDLPFERQYQFWRLLSGTNDIVRDGSHEILLAGGRFRQSAAEALRLSAETGNPLHISRGADERPFLTVRNPARRAIRWRTLFHGEDFLGRTFEVPFAQTVEAGQTVRVELPWPLPAKGFWRVSCDVEGDDGSRARHETAFAVIDRHVAGRPVPRERFRFGVHYHGTHYLPNNVKPTVDALVACGAKLVRTDYSFMFAHVERQEGVFDWEKADFMLKTLRDAGMSLDIIVGGTPAWAWDPNGNWAKTNPKSRYGVRPSRPGLFRDFCRRIAARYGREIDYYEMGNEWDFSPADALTPEEALRMQREGYEGVHAGCPDAWVIPNGWAHVNTSDLEGSPEHVNKGLVEALAQHPELFDAWALHGHGGPSAYIHQIDDIFLPFRAATPMGSRPWLSNESSQTGAFGNEEQVTQTVWKKPLFAWSRGAIDFIWYNLRATGWFDGHEPGFGLMTPDYRPRATYAAFAALTKIFGGLESDGTVYSKRHRHILRFRGANEGFEGIVLAAWDDDARLGLVRPVRLRTDATRVFRSDIMGNLTPEPCVEGVFVVRPVPNPQAYLLEGATRADAVDPQELPAKPPAVKEIADDSLDRPPDFVLDSARHVKDYYAANPALTDRLWKGPSDHAARIWLSRTADGVELRAEVTDDISAPGDRFEALVTVGGKTWTHPVRRLFRDGTTDVYEAELPIRAAEFGFDVRVFEDDGDGLDGCLRIVEESDDPVRIRFAGDPAGAAMGEAYRQIWNPEEMRRLDEDIARVRQADAAISVAAAPGTTVEVEQVGHAFRFGAHIFNFDQLGTPARNRRYRELYGTLFNSATVGFYWADFEPERGMCRFAPEARDSEAFWNAQGDPCAQPHWRRPATDLPIGWCLKRGVRVHGHPLVWNAANAIPRWLYATCLPAEEKTRLGFPDLPPDFRGESFRRWYLDAYEPWYRAFVKTHSERDFARLAPVFTDSLRAVQEARIRAIAAHYGNRVQSWDVVNESCDEVDAAKGVPSGLPVTFGDHGVGGADFVLSAFRTAAEAFPADVALNINECNVNRVYTNEIVLLEKAGARIDVVGAQMHLFGTNALDEIARFGGERDKGRWGSTHFWQVESPAQVRARIGMLAALGKPVHMSEITISAPGEDAKARLRQAVVARNLYKAWFSCPAVCGITWWNVVDGCGYAGEPTTSGLFTRDMRPKAAFHALNNLVNREWKTKARVAVTPDGQVRFRGFRGHYRLSWKDADGRTRTTEADVR